MSQWKLWHQHAFHMKVDIGENRPTKKKKGNPTNNLFLLQHLQEIKYLVHNMHWCNGRT
jgi:hypothetical protein